MSAKGDKRVTSNKIIFAFALLFISAAGLRAQAPNATALPMDAAGHPDLSGYWELRWDSKSVPRAALTPEFQKSDAQAKAREDDIKSVRACTPVGMPGVMDNASTIDLRQSPKFIGVIAKVPSSARYIYTDGRKHPDKDELDATTNGNSMGRWEGDTLVVDTIGFNDRGLRGLPGGGMRTPDSHLVERFKLINADVLSVTFTWDDPKVFRTPHSYEYRYYRTEITNPRLLAC